MLEQQSEASPLLRSMALALMTLPFVFFVTPQQPWFWTTPGVLAAGMLLARKIPTWRGHALLWSVFAAALGLALPWPFSLILPSALVLTLGRYLPSLREIAGKLRRGSLDRGTSGLAALIAVVSSGALWTWFVWGGADVSDMVALLPRRPLPVLLAGSLVFAIANATWEELLMKWLVWDGVERLVQSRGFVGVFQAALCGLLHLHGFPRGWLGVTLAGVYGLLLGALRARSGGLLALLITHALADVTICLLLLSELAR